jgi:hypothetical protein
MDERMDWREMAEHQYILHQDFALQGEDYDTKLDSILYLSMVGNGVDE